MKIGILTYHCSYNPGAMLQAFALEKFLSSLNYNVEIIDYRPFYRETKIRFQKWIIRQNIIKGIHYTFIEYPFLIKYYKKYHLFEDKFYTKSDTVKTEDELINYVSKYDYVIIGSDQVWQSAYNGHESVWYGNKITDLKSTRILTYAASAGKGRFDDWEYELFRKNLSKFYAISVREASVKNILDNIVSGLNIKIVLDPVLMVDPSLWEINYTKLRQDKYIVVYQGRKSDAIFSIAKNIAKSIGKDCKIISTDLYANSYNSGLIHMNVSPLEFASLIKDAQCVITTSFHGTIVSIAQHTQFYYLALNDGDNNRVEHILKVLKLENRIIHDGDNIFLTDIDYTESEVILSSLRQESQEFLIKSLHK